MKWCIASLLTVAAVVCAQDTSVRQATSVDINGNRVAAGSQMSQTKTKDTTVTTETTQSINGRAVPLERVEERVVRDDGSVRVVERTIRRYDPQGNPTPPVRETTEEVKRADGSSTTMVSTYRGDINGSMQLTQKSVTEVHASGSTESSETTVQRPTVNGSLDTVEKQQSVKFKDATGGGYRQESTTYRSGGNGGFYAAVKTTTEHKEQGSQATDNTVEYEAAPGGELAVHSQTVTKTVTGANGAKDTVVDVFGTNVPGTVNTSGALKLQERQLIQQTPGANDMVTQTTSVQRPTINDPNTLSAPRELSQTVCKGNCKP